MLTIQDLLVAAVIAGSAGPLGSAAPPSLGSATANQGWSPEGVYQWNVELIGGLGGTLTVFKRPDGTWSAHGTLGGTQGEMLLGKAVEVKPNSVEATLESSQGEIKIKVTNKGAGLDGMVTLVEPGIVIEAKIARAGS